MGILAEYQNGNYHVTLHEDGTKIKATEGELFLAAFPDSMDLKITNFCDLACPMCHENAGAWGQHADLSAAFLEKLHGGTELAIGGGNPLAHPDLLPFLKRMQAQGVVCNMTVNETHLQSDREEIESLLERRLIWGLGISLNQYSEETLQFTESHPNTVLHLICGMVTQEEWTKLFDRDLKILLLGYKRFGRGKAYYSAEVEKKIHALRKALPSLLDRFAVVSFDNLAITQLRIKALLSPEAFEEMFMGEDGDATMYVDLVKGEFALSSTSSLRYPILGTAEEMLQFLQQKKKK